MKKIRLGVTKNERKREEKRKREAKRKREKGGKKKKKGREKNAEFFCEPRVAIPTQIIIKVKPSQHG